MIKKIALLLILLIKLIETTKYSDFCYRTRIKNKIKECQENNKYKFNCGKDLCSIDQYSCKSLAVFSMVTKHQKNEFYYFKNSEKKHLYFKKKLELFMRSIKDCPKPQDYKWNSNDVCMNTNDCFKAHGYGIWSIFYQNFLKSLKSFDKGTVSMQTRYCSFEGNVLAIKNYKIFDLIIIHKT